MDREGKMLVHTDDIQIEQYKGNEHRHSWQKKQGSGGFDGHIYKVYIYR